MISNLFLILSFLIGFELQLINCYSHLQRATLIAGSYRSLASGRPSLYPDGYSTLDINLSFISNDNETLISKDTFMKFSKSIFDNKRNYYEYEDTVVLAFDYYNLLLPEHISFDYTNNVTTEHFHIPKHFKKLSEISYMFLGDESINNTIEDITTVFLELLSDNYGLGNLEKCFYFDTINDKIIYLNSIHCLKSIPKKAEDDEDNSNNEDDYDFGIEQNYNPIGYLAKLIIRLKFRTFFDFNSISTFDMTLIKSKDSFDKYTRLFKDLSVRLSKTIRHDNNLKRIIKIHDESFYLLQRIFSSFNPLSSSQVHLFLPVPQPVLTQGERIDYIQTHGLLSTTDINEFIASDITNSKFSAIYRYKFNDTVFPLSLSYNNVNNLSKLDQSVFGFSKDILVPVISSSTTPYLVTYFTDKLSRPVDDNLYLSTKPVWKSLKDVMSIYYARYHSSRSYFRLKQLLLTKYRLESINCSLVTDLAISFKDGDFSMPGLYVKSESNNDSYNIIKTFIHMRTRFSFFFDENENIIESYYRGFSITDAEKEFIDLIYNNKLIEVINHDFWKSGEINRYPF